MTTYKTCDNLPRPDVHLHHPREELLTPVWMWMHVSCAADITQAWYSVYRTEVWAFMQLHIGLDVIWPLGQLAPGAVCRLSCCVCCVMNQYGLKRAGFPNSSHVTHLLRSVSKQTLWPLTPTAQCCLHTQTMESSLLVYSYV